MLSRHIRGMAHEVFDLDAARRVFDPLERQLGGEDISSPFDLYSIETLRDRHQLRISEAFSTDVFVWAEGEPARREITKVGGLPYCPTSEPWPSTKKGKPYEFIAQFNFQDSLELHPDLPADVVLVLFAKDGENWKYEPNTILPTWVNVRDRELIQQLPKGLLLTGNSWVTGSDFEPQITPTRGMAAINALSHGLIPFLHFEERRSVVSLDGFKVEETFPTADFFANSDQFNPTARHLGRG